MALDNHVWSHLTRTRIPQTREAAARASQDLRRALCLAAPSLLWNQAWRGRGGWALMTEFGSGERR